MKAGKGFVQAILVCTLAACLSLAQGQGKDTTGHLLSRRLADNEAYIWYLRNSGWAVRTRNHFLVFDYVGSDAQPGSPSLSSGQINAKRSAPSA